MLNYCFSHIPGVGSAFEAKLSEAGIITWNDALTLPLPCSAAKQKTIKLAIEESIKRLECYDIRWFSDALAPCEQWRLFPHFENSVAYVDIETTGLSINESIITTIALYDGNKVKTYVQGQNLEAFADDILSYQLLVTWNGRCFDAPLLRKQLTIPLDKGDKGHMGHLDLLPVFRKLNLRGGLKKVEKLLDIDRGELDGVDGMAAVILWHEYEKKGDVKALETLLAYNAADVLSLEVLAHYAVQLHTKPCIPPIYREVKNYLNPFAPDTKLLKQLLFY